MKTSDLRKYVVSCPRNSGFAEVLMFLVPSDLDSYPAATGCESSWFIEKSKVFHPPTSCCFFHFFVEFRFGPVETALIFFSSLESSRCALAAALQFFDS